MKKVAKILWIVVGIVFLFTIFIIFVADKSDNNEENRESEIIQREKEWSSMTYEERNLFLEKAIDNKTFSNSTDIEIAMRNAIKKEVRNPKTLSFVWSPSIYNGDAIIVEADSGWINVPFKCNVKNDFGIEKEIVGSVMYLYNPQTSMLEVKKWDINQND